MTTMSINAATWDFIRVHRAEPAHDVALHAKTSDNVDMRQALDCIAGWQIARAKIPDWAQRDTIMYPPHLSMEQCSSQHTALHKAALAGTILTLIDSDEPRRLVDLTGGFGVDCFFMAPNFDDVVYVERNETLCEIAEHNVTVLRLPQVTVVHGEAEDYLDSMQQASLIAIDPARRDANGSRTYAIADCTPDVLALKEQLFAHAPHVLVKLSPMLDWRATVEEFHGAVREVHIVAVGNECKELLLWLDRQYPGLQRVVCINDDNQVAYTPQEAQQATLGAATRAYPTLEEIAASQYCYEWNVSLMKAGCFPLLASRYGVRDIAANSHISIADTLIANAPARIFAIRAVARLGKKEIKRALNGIVQANVSVRNFPLSAAQLRAKLRVKDGGNTMIIGTTLHDGSHVIIVTERIDAASVPTAA